MFHKHTLCARHLVTCQWDANMEQKWTRDNNAPVTLPPPLSSPEACQLLQKLLIFSVTLPHRNVMYLETRDSALFFMVPQCLAHRTYAYCVVEEFCSLCRDKLLLAIS